MAGPGIFRLRVDQRAPLTSDRLIMKTYSGGYVGWSGVVSLGDDAAFGISTPVAQALADAEHAAIAWAEACGSRYLAVEVEDVRSRHPRPWGWAHQVEPEASAGASAFN